MTTFTSPKGHIVSKVVAVSAIAFCILLLPAKLFSQDNKQPGLVIKTLPPVTATVTYEAEDPFGGDDAEEISGKYGASEDPNSNFMLPPPPNDNCSSALLAAHTLTPGSNYKCSGAAAMMGNATVEVGEYTGCFTPAPVGTVWYSFTADQPTMWIAVKPSASTCGTTFGTVPSSFGLAVYQSTTCFPSTPVACLNYYSAIISAANFSVFSKLNLTGLTPGQVYMIQIAWYASCAGNTWKPHCIKIGHPSTCTTCATNCGPMCVWAGPTPPLVTDITTTCPSYGWAPPMNLNDAQTNCFSFTATNDTVFLQQIVYSYCNPNTISFTYNLYNAACGLIQSGNVFVNNQITGLVVGTTYKICYTLQAACSWDSVFWPYAYTTSTTLPVEMVSFGAMPYKDKVKIYWATASEENSKEFIIEKTQNGMDFTEVAHVKAAGNSTQLINYKAYDDRPRAGNNYYRIKQVDFNGEFTYTKLVAAKYGGARADLSIVPNPAKDKAIITFNSSGNYPAVIKVHTMQGSSVVDKQFFTEEGLNEFTLNMNEFPKGIYTVQLIVDDQNMISKLVKD